MGRRVCALIVVMLGLCGIAAADTGGHIGGGSWGSPSSSSSRSSWSSSSPSHSWSSSSPSDYSYHSSSYRSSSSSGDDTVFIIIGIVLSIVIAGIKYAMQNAGNNDYDYGNNAYSFAPSAPVDLIDTTVLRIAVDGRARKFVQNEIARIAKSADTATSEGRATMLREIALMLRRIRDAWVYGGAVNEPMRGMSGAKANFDKHVMDARARFTNETISNVQGQKEVRDGGNYTPRSEEGEGLILVTIVIAARGELFTIGHIADGEDLRKALDNASQRSAQDLVAIDVIWQPSDENDRMSSIELVAKYPQPDLFPIRDALVGKMFCTYCSGPFPAELVSCPHCGAPAREAA